MQFKILIKQSKDQQLQVKHHDFKNMFLYVHKMENFR